MNAYIHNLFLSGCLLWLPAAVSACLGWRRARNLFALTAALCLLLSAVVRFYYYWPLMCLFQEPYLISLFASLIALAYLLGRGDEPSGMLAGGAAAVLSLLTLLFPGDIYTSFVKIHSLFAFLFSLASSLARAAYLCAGTLAVGWLWGRFRSPEMATERFLGPIRRLVILGFAAQSLGMFCGALWSYVGWGMPIQWESPLLLGMAGVWFYYSCFLHLHLEGGSGRQAILPAAAAGGILVFVFTFLPDTGVFHLQGFIR